MRELIVYSRPGCHLCELLLEQLEPMCRSAGVRLDVQDVDTREEWRRLYGERIPVVCAGEEELSAWPFDRDRVSRWLGLA